MPYCPTCKFEYRRGIARCPDCGDPLLDGALPPPQSTPLPSPETESVRLCRVADPAEAEIVHTVLANNGIPSVINFFGPLTGQLVRVADGVTHDYALIFVPRNRLEDAKRLLADMEAFPVEWPEGMEPEE
jgi:hypothetical protein